MCIPKPILVALAGTILVSLGLGQQKSQTIKQPPDVINAYRICEQFQKILSQNLDFNAAFDSTFTTDKSRQRGIAIKDGELGDIDFAGVDDQTLINAYKSRMQLIYLMFPLMSPSDAEEAVFFPAIIQAMFKRKNPANPVEFATFASQLERDSRDFRAHLDKLVAKYPAVAERVRKFKSDLVTGDFAPPKSSLVTPLKYYGSGGGLSTGESYYQIEGYTVVRENGQMKIAGIKFFTRLF